MADADAAAEATWRHDDDYAQIVEYASLPIASTDRLMIQGPLTNQ
jgi:hypothetical protein